MSYYWLQQKVIVNCSKITDEIIKMCSWETKPKYVKVPQWE